MKFISSSGLSKKMIRDERQWRELLSIYLISRHRINFGASKQDLWSFWCQELILVSVRWNGTTTIFYFIVKDSWLPLSFPGKSRSICCHGVLGNQNSCVLRPPPLTSLLSVWVAFNQGWSLCNVWNLHKYIWLPWIQGASFHGIKELSLCSTSF